MADSHSLTEYIANTFGNQFWTVAENFCVKIWMT